VATTGATRTPVREAAPATREAAAALLPQRITRSYYMADGSRAGARNLGCAQGDKTGRMSLFFGAPAAVGAGYGATLWGAPNMSTSAIAGIVMEFTRGYVWCRRSPDYTLFIGIGTSNSTIDRRSDSWLRGHGRAWSGMVAIVAAWADRHYPGRARIYGAMDMEPSWSSYGKARQWRAGYGTVAGRRGVHANNSADGCPQYRASNGACSNGWTQERVWRTAWEWDPALPVPQIYATSGANARQWHMIDRYGAGRGDGMYFFGAMSQRAACTRVGDGACPGTDLTARQSHDYLLWYTNSHPATVQPRIDSPTDIDWHY
jgi:hypothetical protein